MEINIAKINLTLSLSSIIRAEIWRRLHRGYLSWWDLEIEQIKKKQNGNKHSKDKFYPYSIQVYSEQRFEEDYTGVA